MTLIQLIFKIISKTDVNDDDLLFFLIFATYEASPNLRNVDVSYNSELKA